MPIEVMTEIRRSTQDEFSAIAYRVMGYAFAVHREIGRFFSERVFKQIIAERVGRAELEVPVIVSHGDFSRTYFLDMLVAGTALFEWKAVDRLSPEHRGQLMNYLQLCDLANSKLINVRTEQIEHEFVNHTLRRADRQRFVIETSEFSPSDESDDIWKQFLVSAVSDWGTGLDLHLYEAAIIHVLGGEEKVLRDIDVMLQGRKVGEQKARLTSSGAVFKVTTFQSPNAAFQNHAERFLLQTTLPALHWINISRSSLHFKTIRR